jgi:glucose/arabinose dehydrogenase
VHNFWDRGLLGMELDFHYESFPYVYVLYTHNAAIGGTAPRWPPSDSLSDSCPDPPGATGDGCVVSGRLSRLVPQPGGGVREDVLVEDWCQQYPSHSIGSLEMDSAGALYATGGDGASFNFADWGQDGNPVNPCNDPHTGSSPTPPNAEGGALRSQDLRTPADPVSLDGSLIRVDASTGQGISGNPMFASSDANARRIVAEGLRNPFRFDLAASGNVWIGDVGWNTTEEIDRLPNTSFRNFGWPCYEGGVRQPGYDAANLGICETLYGLTNAVVNPYFAYDHSATLAPGDTCRTGSSSISGMRTYDGADATSFPGVWANALFFADYSRDCIWAMRAGANGLPDAATVQTFDAGAANPVWLEVGPDGALYYADLDGGRVMRIQSTATNQSPAAAISADPTSGHAPLEVDFDGTASSDPDHDSLTYAWDLDGDGELDDSSSASPTFTYTTGGSYDVKLRVSDGRGGSDTATTTIDVDNSPPVPTITSPLPTLRWAVGDHIDFSGSAEDAEDGTLPDSALRWKLLIRHCPSNCHTHPVQGWVGTAGETLVAPDHEWRSYLLLRLAATDSDGVRASTQIRLVPRTSLLRLTSEPPGAELALDGTSGAAPLRERVIVGSQHTISAPTPQTLGGEELDFRNWSDGGAATHTVTAGATNETLRARFR